MERNRNQWLELVTELPSCGYFTVGSQKLRFPENPAQGYRRVELLRHPYRAEKVARRLYKEVRLYDPTDPKTVEENIKRVLQRDGVKWGKYLDLELDQCETHTEWNGNDWLPPCTKTEYVSRSSGLEVTPEVTEVEAEVVDEKPPVVSVNKNVKFMTLAEVKEELAKLGLPHDGDDIKALKQRLREATGE